MEHTTINTLFLSTTYPPQAFTSAFRLQLLSLSRGRWPVPVLRAFPRRLRLPNIFIMIGRLLAMSSFVCAVSPRFVTLLTHAKVKMFLLDCKVTWAACAVLFKALTTIDSTELPEPLRTFMTSDLAVLWATFRRGQPEDMVISPLFRGLSGTDPTFRHVLHHPTGSLQPSDARMLMGILAQTLNASTSNAIKNRGSCCVPCSNGQGESALMTDCRILDSNNVSEEDVDGIKCPSCYAQGLDCVWLDMLYE
jgi:hypothetical protein